MRKGLLLTTAATVALFASVAAVNAATPAPHILVAANSAVDVDVKKLIGRSVVDPNNATIGKLDSVLVDNDGKAKFVIIDVGGWLGIGGREVAVHWDQLTFVDNNEKIVLNTTKEQLAALPRTAILTPRGKERYTPIGMIWWPILIWPPPQRMRPPLPRSICIS